MRFSYKAFNTNNEVETGEAEAADKFTLARDLRVHGLTVVSAEELGQKKEKNSFKLFGQSVKLKDKILFAGNLSSMLSAGLSLSRSLEVLGRQTKKKYFQEVIKELLSKVGEGKSFSEALGSFPKVFPPVFISMVAAGEESGKLSESLSLVRDQFQKTYELRRKVKGAMIYPAVIIAVIIIIAILMMIYMVPTLTATFNDLNVELPLATRAVIAISDFLTNHFLIFIFSVLAVVSAIVGFVRTKKGKRTLDYFILHLPLVGEVAKEVNSAVIMRTTSSLISAGVNMVETIKIASRVVQNSYYQEAAMEAVLLVEKGQSLSSLFKERKDIFPVLVGELTEVGEETGNISSMLLKGAEFYEGEVDQVTKNLSTIIEPALMIVIGTAVGFFVVAMIGPMYSLTEAIN